MKVFEIKPSWLEIIMIIYAPLNNNKVNVSNRKSVTKNNTKTPWSKELLVKPCVKKVEENTRETKEYDLKES